MKITFLGAGAFGTALESIALYNGHETKFYDPIKFPAISLGNALNGAEVVVYCAPSDQAAKLLPKLDKSIPLICASKGFLSLEPFSDFKHFSALSGAGFAKDIKAALDIGNEKATKISLAGTSELIEQLFSTEKITIEYTKDTLGVLLCGALKNIYAIGAGYHSSDASMTYLKGAILEMSDILSYNGADKDTLRLSCGVADLVLSCNEGSRNYRYGEELKNSDHIKGRRLPDSNLIEGVSAIMSLDNYSDFKVPASATTFYDIVELVKKEEHAAE